MIKNTELFDFKNSIAAPLFEKYEYPWEILPDIKEFILNLTKKGLEDYEEIRHNIYVGKNVKIAENVVIEPPCIIGHGTEIRPGAYIRGSVITGENCVIGNSSEIKNALLLDKVAVPHYNYVGDSILGNHSHMGAGSICSNLKSDGKAVVIHGESEINTGLRKIGAILGDGADIGCGCVLNPGTVIGKNTSVYPLTMLRGVYESNSIIKSTHNTVKRNI